MATLKAKGKASRSRGLEDSAIAFRVELGERVRWLLDLFESRSESAEIAGVTPEHLASYIAGRAKPPFELIGRLARAKGVSLDWIATGQGERGLASAAPEGFVIVQRLESDASSGPGTYAPPDESPDNFAFSRAWLQTAVRGAPASLRVVFNRGVANEPVIRDGDAMLVDISVTKIVDDAYYIFQTEGRLLTKLVETYVDGRVVLKARNPEFETQVLAREDAARLNIYGRVCWRGGLL